VFTWRRNLLRANTNLRCITEMREEVSMVCLCSYFNPSADCESHATWLIQTDIETIRRCHGSLQSFKLAPSNEETSARCSGQVNIPSMQGMLIKAFSSLTGRLWTNLLWSAPPESSLTGNGAEWWALLLHVQGLPFSIHDARGFVSFLVAILGECLKIGHGPLITCQFQFLSITIVRRYTECLKIRAHELEHAIPWWTLTLQCFLTEFQLYIIFAENAIKVEMSLRHILISIATKNRVMESVGANDTCIM
jgi:hypothetical protein